MTTVDTAAVPEKGGRLPDLLLLLLGLAFGVSVQFDAIFLPIGKEGVAEVAVRALLAGIGAPLFFFLLRRSLRAFQRSLSLQASEHYLRYDTLTYLVFLLPMVGASELRITPTLVYSVLFLFPAAQFLLIALSLAKVRQNVLHSPWIVPVAFQISGFCALIYQVVWQRVLFTAFGVNIESITVVVSVFMFGLGLGSLLGGYLSSRFPGKLPLLFMACEVLTGLFGLVSLRLIRLVSDLTSHASMLSTAQLIFALLFIPTLLMGATLPVLVTYMFRRMRHVGESVGTLYFINTLGAAIGCFVTTDILFALLGKQCTLYLASAGNFLIGLLIYNHSRGQMEASGPVEAAAAREGHETGRGRLWLVLTLSCLTGYVSLSQEILWFRAISYVSGGKPVVFGHTLGAFLLGVAGGALAGKRACLSRKNISLPYIAAMLTLSSALYYYSMPLISRYIVVSEPSGMYTAYLLVGAVSFLMGGIFPVLCHEGISATSSIGMPMSWIYFANIIGSTAGPLVTGFVLLDLFPLQDIVLYLSIFTLVVAAAVCAVAPLPRFGKGASLLAVVFLAAGMYLTYDGLYAGMLEKFQFKSRYRPGKEYKYLIQNRSGIIGVERGTVDSIYGGGMYDGKFSIDPVQDANGITRAYMLAAVHRKPADVLEIGLSSGSWAKAISTYSDLNSLTVVEINPGYRQLIPRYPEIASILHDPKVRIVTDDGRRWLNSNPAARFDVIIMNTTFHWRDGMTNLLSEEFQQLCKRHLKRGGVLYYNTTGSEDAVYTAAKGFRHITRYANFVAASDAPFAMTKEEIRGNLLKFTEKGVPILGGRSLGVLNALASYDLSDKGDAIRGTVGLRVITDDNMATEFKSVVR